MKFFTIHPFHAADALRVAGEEPIQYHRITKKTNITSHLHLMMI